MISSSSSLRERQQHDLNDTHRRVLRRQLLFTFCLFIASVTTPIMVLWYHKHADTEHDELQKIVSALCEGVFIIVCLVNIFARLNKPRTSLRGITLLRTTIVALVASSVLSNTLLLNYTLAHIDILIRSVVVAHLTSFICTNTVLCATTMVVVWRMNQAPKLKHFRFDVDKKIK